jgi:hypothetical protein
MTVPARRQAHVVGNRGTSSHKVLSTSDRFKVRWIAASTDSAQVIQVEAGWDLAAQQFPNKTVRVVLLPIPSATRADLSIAACLY